MGTTRVIFAIYLVVTMAGLALYIAVGATGH
jgi:hypothetical protein